MSIKPTRQIDADEARYFLNEASEAGVVVSISTAGSGTSMDSAANLITVKGASSGALPVGMLVNEFVDIDETRFPVNWNKDQANKGSKATVMTKGWLVTDKVVGSNDLAGKQAVLASSGFVASKATNGTHNEVSTPTVGRFRTDVDEDGYAAVYIDL